MTSLAIQQVALVIGVVSTFLVAPGVAVVFLILGRKDDEPADDLLSA